MIYREVCERDLDELLDVRATTRENALSREQLARMGITPASIAESIAGGRTKGWVCSSDSRIVGFCMGDSDRGEVIVLAVLPEYERKGIGRTLLSLVVDWLCAFNPTRVWLGASRDPATRAYGFYRALGWRPTGETDTHGDEILVLSTVALTPSPRRT
jgi:ribosomal protein S18 acetylase RimI-like enzyme